MTSFLDDLRARHDGKTGGRRIRLTIPGWGGRLVGEFRPLTIKEFAAAGRRMPTDKQIAAGDPRVLRTIAAPVALACVQVWGRGEDGTLVALSDDPELPPVRFDERLTAGLGLPECSGPDAVVEVLQAEADTAPLIALQGKLMEWMEGTVEEVSEEIAGE